MDRKRFSLELSEALLSKIDQFKREWGLRSRGAIVERLLLELLPTEDSEDLFSEDIYGEDFYSKDIYKKDAIPEGSVGKKVDNKQDDHQQNNGNQDKDDQDVARQASSVNALGKAIIRKDPGAQTDDSHNSQFYDQATKTQQPGRGRVSVSASPSNQQTKITGLGGSDFNERGALVLVAKGAGGSLGLDFDSTSSDEGSAVPEQSSRSGGIDLPGFVRKQSAQIKRSLTPTHENSSRQQEPLPTVPGELLNQGLERAKNHWLELYGTPANEAVLEAAMVWLAKDIWPQCDQSEGRLFTWSLACSVIEAFAPTWPPGGASFEKVMVMAGLLEDPFSNSTLQLRLPTLIRRFVHRYRTRKKGTSFQALEHTMTLHGALKLLQLPTSPGHKLVLSEIREAYREIALTTHPDSGGSEEEMRKVNEAYQLLKELYRNG